MQLDTLILPLKTEDNAFRAGLSRAVQLVQGAVGAMSGFIASGVKGWQEAQDAIAQVDAVIQSTGGAAGVTRDEIVAMSDAFEMNTKFSAEATMAGQSMLLTFTSIGKKVFPMATKTVLDMSQALGQDTKASAIQLGKALNDPIRGVTALRKVGVQFTDDQEKLIKTLVDTGRLEEAQTLILKELQVEFGGSAEAAGKTFSGQLEILKNQIGAVSEIVVDKAMPAFQGYLETTNEFIGRVRNILEGEGTMSQKAGEIFANVDAFIGNAIGNMAVSVENWVAGGGPEELSNKLISWIDGLGDENNQSRIITAAQKLITALGTAIGTVDWEGIGIAIDTKLSETLDSIDWESGGTSFGAGIETFFTTGWDFGTAGASAKMPASIQSFLDGVDNFFQAAVGANQFGGWKAYFAAWGEQIKTGWNSMMDVWKASFTAKINDWGTSVIAAFTAQINKIIDLRNKIPFFPDMGHISAPSSAGQNISAGGGRASGGPVIGGQTYNVAEFYKPERFTPATNGRVDPIDSGGGDITSVITMIAQTLADEIGRSNRVAFEKAGRR